MIDTHCHIFKQFYPDVEEVIKKMKNNIIIVSGTNDTDNKEVLSLCKKYKNVYGTLGIHPEELNSINDETFNFIEKHLMDDKIVGIGEIGLDYHFDKTNIDLQKKIFMYQLDLAKKYNKPVVIHSRDAVEDTLNILKSYKEIKKDIHCYSGSVESAKEFIKLNSKLGIGGVITFKNAKKLIEVITNIDLDYLLLETDSPFLSPEPFRGKKNEPYNVYYVALKIAQIKNISIEEVLSKTYENAISQFDLDMYL